jgi:hypothetical protein
MIQEPNLFDKFGHSLTLLLIGFIIGVFFALIFLYQVALNIP